MMTTDLLVRHRTLAVFSLVLALVVVGIIVWWRFPGSTLTAQERMEDICATGDYPASYDLFERATSNGSESRIEYDVRVDSGAEHYLVSIDGGLVQEAIFLYPDAEGPENSGRSGTPAQATAYIRLFGDDEWGEWGVSTDESGSARGSSSARTDGDEVESFCGLPLEAPGVEVDFRYVGKETIGGISTDHYYHSYSRIGVDQRHSMEFWFDSDGLFRQIRQIEYSGPDAGDEVRIEHLKTYSGWGEANVITAPEGVTPPEPEPNPTSTPRPTNTPAAATATPTEPPKPTRQSLRTRRSPRGRLRQPRRGWSRTRRR